MNNEQYEMQKNIERIANHRNSHRRVWQRAQENKRNEIIIIEVIHTKRWKEWADNGNSERGKETGGGSEAVVPWCLDEAGGLKALFDNDVFHGIEYCPNIARIRSACHV